MTPEPPDPLRDDDEDDARPKGGGREIVSGATGVQPTDRVPPHTAVPEPPSIEDGGVGGTKFLSHLLTRSPFLDYFVRLSEAQYSGRDRDERMRNAGQAHPRLLRLCIFADMVLRIVVVLLLLAATAAVAYKTIWPLPAPSFGD